MNTNKVNTGRAILSFLFPPVGVISYFQKKDESPKIAKSYAFISAISVGLYVGGVLLQKTKQQNLGSIESGYSLISQSLYDIKDGVYKVLHSGTSIYTGGLLRNNDDIQIIGRTKYGVKGIDIPLTILVKNNKIYTKNENRFKNNNRNHRNGGGGGNSVLFRQQNNRRQGIRQTNW